jgi:adenylate kinase family enzyme
VQKLSRALDLPVIELDSIFWQPGPRPMPDRDWAEAQLKILERDRWIIDGDLGPYDSELELRLRAADTVVVLNFPLWRCVWQARRRSRENREVDVLAALTQQLSYPHASRCALVLSDHI